MSKVVDISEYGLSILVSERGMVTFTAKDRSTQVDTYLPFREQNGLFHISFSDLEQCLSSDDPKSFYDVFLWINGFRVEKVTNSRDALREYRKTLETVVHSTKAYRKTSISPFKSSRDTLGLEVVNHRINKKEYISEEGVRVEYLEKIIHGSFMKKLIVTFPYNAPAIPYAKNSEAPFQYVNTLINLGASKIFLRDTGKKAGNWFLGTGDFKNRDAIIEFLEAKFEELGVDKKDVIFFGVSKGAYNAILFGLLLGVSNVIGSSAIGQVHAFLKDRPREQYIFPGAMTDEQIEMYDDLIGAAAMNVDPAKAPNIYVITNKNDEYYHPHIPYLQKVFEENGINHLIYHNPNPDITRHGLVYKYSRNEIYNLFYQLICGQGLSLVEE